MWKNKFMKLCKLENVVFPPDKDISFMPFYVDENRSFKRILSSKEMEKYSYYWWHCAVCNKKSNPRWTKPKQSLIKCHNCHRVVVNWYEKFNNNINIDYINMLKKSNQTILYLQHGIITKNMVIKNEISKIKR